MPKPNTNCLENMRCPKCGEPDYLWITGRQEGEFLMTDDGVNDERVHGTFWEEDSQCRCAWCAHTAKVRDFRIKKDTAPENEQVPQGPVVIVVPSIDDNWEVDNYVCLAPEGMEAFDAKDKAEELVAQAAALYSQEKHDEMIEAMDAVFEQAGFQLIRWVGISTDWRVAESEAEQDAYRKNQAA